MKKPNVHTPIHYSCLHNVYVYIKLYPNHNFNSNVILRLKPSCRLKMDGGIYISWMAFTSIGIKLIFCICKIFTGMQIISIINNVLIHNRKWNHSFLLLYYKIEIFPKYHKFTYSLCVFLRAWSNGTILKKKIILKVGICSPPSPRGDTDGPPLGFCGQ